MQEYEEPLPAPKAARAPEANEEIVQTLMALGLGSLNACKRAALGVGNANADLAAAWLMEHMNDADIDNPVVQANQGGAVVNPDDVEMLTAMGFSARQAEIALKRSQNDPQRAADWLFSHVDELDAIVAQEAENRVQVQEKWNDGAGKYELVGIISHLGKSTDHGHYVAHVKKASDKQWYFFNDGKVAISEAPPFEVGYLYMFRRKDIK
jgi:ubiquitin carboxyl-terminal hydrolase 5/13